MSKRVDEIKKKIEARKAQMAVEANKKVEAEKGWNIEIGSGLYITRAGMDTNGNFSIWVSQGSNSAKKIQTNGNLPEIHSNNKVKNKEEFEKGLTNEMKEEIKKYWNEYIKKEKPENKTEARKIEADDMTDKNGTPLVGDAPETNDGEVVNTDYEGEENQNKEENEQEKLPEIGTQEAEKPVEASDSKPAELSTNISLNSEKSLSALVKLKDALESLEKEKEVNDAVLKTINTILKEAGLPVSAIKKFAQHSSPVKVNAKAKESAFEVVARAENIYKNDIEKFQMSVLASDESSDRYKELKTIYMARLEEAGDKIQAVLESKATDEKKEIENAVKIIAEQIKEWDGFKKEHKILDKVNATMSTIQSLVDNKVIESSAIAQEFCEYYNMSDIERRKVSASLIEKNQGVSGLVSAKISAAAMATENPKGIYTKEMGRANLSEGMIAVAKKESSKKEIGLMRIDNATDEDIVEV